MKNQNLTIMGIISFLLFLNGCARVHYVGQSYSPTTDIDVFYSEHDIQNAYTVIGHATSSGAFLTSNDDIQNNLIKEAREKGADAIIIKDISTFTSSSTDDGGDIEKRQIKASYIKYK